MVKTVDLAEQQEVMLYLSDLAVHHHGGHIFLPAGIKNWVDKTRDSGSKAFREYTLFDWFALFLPCLKWLRTYKIKEYLLVSCTHEFYVIAMTTTSLWQLCRTTCDKL